MWIAIRRCAAFAEPDSVVMGVSAFANAFSVEDAVLLNSTVSSGTGDVVRNLVPALPFTMADLFSLSFLQILSLLSFLTSVFAVVCVGAGSLHRLSHKLEANLNRSPSQMNIAGEKTPLWNWNLGGSFSLGSLIGEDEEVEVGGARGYTGGSDLMRMNWQISKPVTVPLPPQQSQPPISMAKLIMSRHLQRKPNRPPRRTTGQPRPSPPSRLIQTTT